MLKSPIKTFTLLVKVTDLLLNERDISPSNKVLFLLFLVFIFMLNNNAVLGYIVIFKFILFFFSFLLDFRIISGNFPFNE